MSDPLYNAADKVLVVEDPREGRKPFLLITPAGARLCRKLTLEQASAEADKRAALIP